MYCGLLQNDVVEVQLSDQRPAQFFLILVDQTYLEKSKSPDYIRNIKESSGGLVISGGRKETT